jgi:adenosylcobinamide-GDP ribazoletransferase
LNEDVPRTRPRQDNGPAAAPPPPPAPEPGLGDDILMSLRFFSRLPTGDRPFTAPNLDRMALSLPFASLIIGLLPALLMLLCVWLGMPSYFAAALGVAGMIVATGAMADDALADAADGLFGGATIERRLEIMKDSRHGTYGVAALALLLIFRVTAAGSVIAPLEAAALLLTAPLIARSGALWLTISLPAARSGGAAAGAGKVTPRNFVIGAAIAVIVSFASAGFAVGLAGLLAAYGICAIVTLGWVVLCRRLIGGQTGDLIGALQALLEIAALTAFMVFV